MDNVISIKDMPQEMKVELLKELGYDSDGTYALDKNGKQVMDKYINKPVKIDNMAILPGSTIILDDNPLSILLYLDEYQ
ncbi:MAG: hypothetical protein LBE76_04345 [Nitrososphaerota archaeon]|jgi:hypothetical protein|nr:hypothetical protein [Nitrososphaerota archaeon]